MKNISRESLFINSFTQILLFFLTRETCFTFLVIPAMFFSSCTEHDINIDEQEEARFQMLKSSLTDMDAIQVADAFIFENDDLKKLHCYQRFESWQEIYSLASGSGEKSLFILCNNNRDKYEWADIKSLSSMSSIISDLENESKTHPVMTFFCNFTAGEDIIISPLPLRSEILVRSIRCDFSKESYSEEKLTDVRAYLTYVNSSCSITAESPILPSRIINTGRLEMDALKQFRDSTLISVFIAKEVGQDGVFPETSLFCYPNNTTEESIGTPFTKLVIEGKIGGDTYYYPIKINPDGGGISKGCRYCYDIVITRAGSTQPDGEIKDSDTQLTMEVIKWKDLQEYDVAF